MDKIALAQFCVPENEPLYETDRDKKPLPAPKWETTISLVDTTKFNVNESECDLNTLNWVKKTSKNWGKDTLIEKVKRYPYGYGWTQDDLEIDIFTPSLEHQSAPKCVSPKGLEKSPKVEVREISTQTKVEAWRSEVPCQTTEELPPCA